MTRLRYIYGLILCLLFLTTSHINAQTSDETIIEFFSSKATMEDDPNKNTYNITIFSPDGEWKMQLNYHSNSMFGTFGNEDFRLSGEGRYYNYARNPKNDMVFYSFTDMNVSVTDEGKVYRVKANCLTNNKKRFIVEATIDAPKAEVTYTDDLGYARVEENPFYGTYAIYAENENYKLSYGVVGSQLTGTFYRADMLMPELHDKKTDKDITITYATATHTKDGENTIMKVELISENHELYNLTMFNGPYKINIVSEENINIDGATMQDVTDMYGCFLFAGANEQYQLGVALRPESAENGKNEWTKDDMIMQYTRLYNVENDTYIPIYDIHATLQQGDKALVLKADITSMDGVLYHATMLLGHDSYMPEPKEVINITFDHVRMLDFTKGMGIVGIGAVVPGECQIRAYLNTTKFEGEFTSSDFIMDMCDIMLVDKDTYVFHDARYVNASMTKDDDRINITIDMYGVDDVLYHCTMYIDPLYSMQDEVELPISINDDVTMMAMREGDDKYGEYTVQFQNLDKTFDEDYNIIGNGYYFSFYLAHEGYSIAGNYGYSDGTMADDEYHVIYENGCEIRIAPVAGTLKINPIEQVSVNIGAPKPLKTYVYDASFQFVGQNGCIYRGEGQNILLCIDYEGKPVNLTEDILQAIDKTLAEKGMRVRKVLRDGKIVIERQGKTYDMRGIKMNLKK